MQSSLWRTLRNDSASSMTMLRRKLSSWSCCDPRRRLRHHNRHGIRAQPLLQVVVLCPCGPPLPRVLLCPCGPPLLRRPSPSGPQLHAAPPPQQQQQGRPQVLAWPVARRPPTVCPCDPEHLQLRRGHAPPGQPRRNHIGQHSVAAPKKKKKFHRGGGRSSCARLRPRGRACQESPLQPASLS